LLAGSIKTTSATMSTGSDDGVQIVEKPWEEAVLEQEEYKTAHINQ
jgi:hypothetical protein